MSQEIGNLLQNFESFIERLRSGINKTLNGELVASKIKEVEMKRDEEVEVVLLAFQAFEIKEEVEIVIPTIVIKLEQVEEDEVVQKKAKLNGIPKLVQENIEKYSNYIYHC